MSNKKPANQAQAWENLKADYAMSHESRFIRRRVNLPAQQGSADWHYRNETRYYQDMEKALDMDRNDAIVGQTVNRAVDNIIQDGFTLDINTGDSGLDTELLNQWQAYSTGADEVDVAGEHTFNQFERYACRNMLTAGDCAIAATSDYALQMWEAHQIRTQQRHEDWFCGVNRDSRGRRRAFSIWPDPVTPSQGMKTEAFTLPVRNGEGYRTLYHVRNPARMNQTRGITAFAPIFELTGMFEDIQFAKVVQQQVVSCFAIFRSQEFIPNVPGGAPQGYGDSTTETTDSGGSRLIEGVGPGMEVTGRPGEKIEGFSPAVPNNEYFAHVKLMLQLIGVNLGLPLCLVLMDGSETNFSGWRGAVDEARKGWRRLQSGIKNQFHTPFFKWWVWTRAAMDPAIAVAAAKSTVNLEAHQWNTPIWSYIEPKADAEGDILRLQNNLTSPRRLHGERGAPWETIARESVDDYLLAIRYAKQAATKLNAEFPEDTPVHWRELLHLPMSNGVQMTMQDPNQFQQEEEPAR